MRHAQFQRSTWMLRRQGPVIHSWQWVSVRDPEDHSHQLGARKACSYTDEATHKLGTVLTLLLPTVGSLTLGALLGSQCNHPHPTSGVTQQQVCT